MLYALIEGMNFTAEEIKSLRMGLGESQAQFAERFAIHQSTVHHWETKGVPVGPARKLIEIIVAEKQHSPEKKNPSEQSS